MKEVVYNSVYRFLKSSLGPQISTVKQKQQTTCSPIGPLLGSMARLCATFQDLFRNHHLTLDNLWEKPFVSLRFNITRFQHDNRPLAF